MCTIDVQKIHCSASIAKIMRFNTQFNVMGHIWHITEMFTSRFHVCCPHFHYVIDDIDWGSLLWLSFNPRIIVTEALGIVRGGFIGPCTGLRFGFLNMRNVCYGPRFHMFIHCRYWRCIFSIPITHCCRRYIMHRDVVHKKDGAQCHK
jgi:hypothetical protein